MSEPTGDRGVVLGLDVPSTLPFGGESERSKMRRFRVFIRGTGTSEYEADKITWLHGWVMLTRNRDGFVVVAWPSDVVGEIREVAGESTGQG